MNTTVYDVREIKERLRPVFDAEPIYKAILFGSYAKGEATEMSDVDIVVDSRGELYGLDFYGVLESVVQALDKDVDLIEISEIRPEASMWDDLRRGVVLYERER